MREKLTRSLKQSIFDRIAKGKQFCCLVIILAGHLAVACGGEYKVPTVRPIAEGESADLGLFSEDICRVPCWYGLELERSTKADALAILPTIPQIL